MRINSRQVARGRRTRAGAVVTEFAICAPLLFFFFFASLEFSRVNMIRQSVENAVYEGARRGIVPGATAADCRASAQTVLNSISASGSTITVTPSVITKDTPQVTVAVSVPVNNNSWVIPVFFEGRSISSSMTLNRERFETSSVP
ncbi:MAG: TadE/TadG family type IV pilus assembly protein [Pirellulales bacterium]